MTTAQPKINQAGRLDRAVWFSFQDFAEDASGRSFAGLPGMLQERDGSAFAQARFASDTGDATSSDPALLAALLRAGIDAPSVVQDVLAGFRVGRRTLFHGVSTSGFGERFHRDDTGRVRILADPEAGELRTTSSEFVESACELLRRACHSETVALELTGGVDSRLLLALCMAAGVTPAFAFTIGDEISDDVQVARELARIAGVVHRTLPTPMPSARLAEDARAFCAASGWMANAASSAWLPSVFRELEHERSAQITGVGGEIAGGFYHTPLDPVFERLPRSVWNRLRLELPGNPASQLFVRTALAEARADLTSWPEVPFRDDAPHSWRGLVDQFYREQRVRMWAIPVLAASSRWYKVCAPYLLPEYLEWSGSRTGRAGPGRAGQIGIIREIAPTLLDIPFQTLHQRRKPSKTKKAIMRARRLLLRQRPKPDIGVVATASSLVNDPEIARELDRLAAELGDALHQSAYRALIANPVKAPYAVGSLVTAAMGLTSRDRWAQVLARSDGSRR